jgi:integrase
VGAFWQKWLTERYPKVVGPEALERAIGESRTYILPKLREWEILTVAQLNLEVAERLRDERCLVRAGHSNGRPASVGTKNRLVSVLRAAGRDLKRMGYLDRDPFEDLTTLEAHQSGKAIPTYTQLRAVSDELDERVVAEIGTKEIGDWRPSRILWLLALGALRWSEGAGLDPESLQGKTVVVTRVRSRDGSERCRQAGQKGKTRAAWRSFPADVQLREVIERLAATAKPTPCGGCGEQTTGRLVSDWKGDPLAYDWWKNRLDAARAAVGGVNWSTRELRHFGASRWLRVNPNLFAVAKWTGHSRPQTLMEHYAHLFPRDTEDMADQLDGYGLSHFD